MKISYNIKISLVILITILLFLYCKSNNKQIQSNIETTINEVQDGDLIFQTSLSSQSLAIQKATKSKYSHCGIIYNNNGKYYVFEAIQPVKLTELEKWIARGKDGKFVIKRLKNSDTILTTDNLQKMKTIGNLFLGKDYDIVFEWNDNKIYCSELIWKIYKR